jgi:SET domain-containing protein
VSAKIGAVPEQPASSWLNPKLSVRESPIAGLGVFALAPVERGEECCRLAGELMTDKRFRVYVADRARYSALAVDEGLHLVQSDGDPTTKGNHSCDPNMWLADSVTVVARRPIAAGYEATIDYALLTREPTWSMECKCGSALCRELVTGEDWRLPELRARYEGHWSPFIERRIRTEGQSA